MAAAGDGEKEERETDSNEVNGVNIIAMDGMGRKEKRKMLKKMKRKQLRREKAILESEEEEARMKNPEEQMRMMRLEEEEKERMERDRLEFEERERKFLQELELKKKMEEEEEEEQRKVDNENANELNEDDEWDYVEEGPAEIIWKGNEIIVKKKKVRVPKKGSNPQIEKQEIERPISNPLAPQSQAFEDYRSAQEVLESVAQQVPNFGTEQDKAHCPFHLKTGVCRFGVRCSRVHFYPDKSHTLLMKNMYSGPGLAWEQDEGLEYTDEEVERSFEDFYEDVHTEFLKFGELVNFKVCKNASSHLRGNVYVHYKVLESAVLAYQSINGRYFAGKQISCEFINVTRWKVAICGEYMKSRLKTCSRGSACNFIHCFRNPGGDYEWADWDKPAPRYWLKKMAALFGCTTDRPANEVSPRYHPRRSRSRGSDSGNHSDEEDDRKRGSHWRRKGDSRGTSKSSQDNHHSRHRRSDYVDMSDGGNDDRKFLTCPMRRSRDRKMDHELARQGSESRRLETYSDKYRCRKRGEGNGKYNNFDLRESPHSDRHCDKQHRHKDKHSLPKKNTADSSDIDSHRDRMDRDEDRCHKHSKESSRKRENETEFSVSGSRGGSLGRDEKSPRKNKRKISRSKSELTDAVSNRERLDGKEEYHRHGRRGSRHHSKDKLGKVDSSAYRCSVEKDDPREKNSDADLDRSLSEKDKVDDIFDFQMDNNLSRYEDGDKDQDRCDEGCESERHHKRYDVESRSKISKSNQGTTASRKVEGGDRNASSDDAYRQPEDERERAYRLAALKKLEEMRKSKDTPVENRDDIEITEIHSHENIFGSTEVGKDMEQISGTSKVDRNATTRKRRRI